MSRLFDSRRTSQPGFWTGADAHSAGSPHPIVLSGHRVPMRDGVELSVDVLLPARSGRFPTVLVRTPYNKVGYVAVHGEFLSMLHEAGYAVAIQDVRGRFNSDGEFSPYMAERTDGYDTVEWVASQAWSDGAVGMTGNSYDGQTTWLAAAEVPPHLLAIAPTCSPPDLFANEPILNGILLLGPFAEWMAAMGRRSFQIPDFLGSILRGHAYPYFEAMPAAGIPSAAGTHSAWWHEFMRHPTFDAFWRQGCYQRDWPRIAVAALNVTGWWDMNFTGAITNFPGMVASGPEAIGRRQRLVIGPWPHVINTYRELNGVDFGEQAIIPLWGHIIRFFDEYLRGIDSGLEAEPQVRVFVLGANSWAEADTWPLPGTVFQEWFLRGSGHANGPDGDGMLAPEAPPSEEPPDTYSYDPLSPVRQPWAMRDGPVDDRPATCRPDVLCYTSAPVAKALDIVGPVSMVLHAESSAPDTDWFARLVDVHPDGSARFLCHGAMRARFRDSLEQPQVMEPGTAYAFRFAMDACGVRLLAGHCLRLEVTSSWFPRYERNSNTGSGNPFTDGGVAVANQAIHHSPGRASYVTLPIM